MSRSSLAESLCLHQMERLASLGRPTSALSRLPKRTRCIRWYIKNIITLSDIFSIEDGFYVIRLCGAIEVELTVDHVISINAATKRVFDSVEKHVLKLVNGIFDHCVGTDALYMGIKEY